jgi:hypothetical protein
MTNVRRLEIELAGMHDLAKRDERFSFTTTGLPPVSYACQWRVPGLERTASGNVLGRTDHEFVVHLPGDFPFVAPSILWRTPIFHPNFRGQRVCLGTLWFGGSSIAAMCESIRRMIVLDDFNVFDPLDVAAATWLREQIRHKQITLPLESV